MDDLIRDLSAQEYKDGFVTEVAQEYVPKGLNEDIIRTISAKKGEPDWQGSQAYPSLPSAEGRLLKPQVS